MSDTDKKYPCLNGCVGHDLEKIRLFVYLPPIPSKNLLIINLQELPK